MGANQRKNYIREKDVLMVEKQKKRCSKWTSFSKIIRLFSIKPHYNYYVQKKSRRYSFNK